MYVVIVKFVSEIAPVQKVLDKQSVLGQGEAPLQQKTVSFQTLRRDWKQIKTSAWCLEG